MAIDSEASKAANKQSAKKGALGQLDNMAKMLNSISK
jgi:hypothetical protein